MVSVPVFQSTTGNPLEALDFEEERLGGEVKIQLLREAIITHEANQHIGTASTKTRSEVSGSNVKPWRQKGTGRARAGHRRSPLWKGGAVVHGPRPGIVRRHLNKKARRSATRSALLAKCLDEGVILVDQIECPEIKTKEIVSLLQTLEIYDTVLIALDPFDPVVWKSARNIPGVKVVDVRNLNAYDLLTPKQVLMPQQAFLKLIGVESVDSDGDESEGSP